MTRTIESAGQQIELRPMTADDADAVLAFVRTVPRHDLMFLPTDITEIEGLNGWIDDVLLGVSHVILAVGADGILGFSSVFRAPTPWTRHIAELRVVVGEEARGHNLGHELTVEAFRAAAGHGVQRMMAQMTFDQQGAINLFRELGFSPLSVLPDQVMDEDGQTYDLLLMHQDVDSFDETLAQLAGA